MRLHLFRAMTRPRNPIAGTSYLLTRRCVQRQFLLLPSDAANNLFRFVLAYAARTFPVAVHAACVMSNHFHLVVTDPAEHLSDFMHRIDMLLGRALNAHYRRGESIFAQGSYSPVKLIDGDDTLEKMVYVLANPVEAGLVARGDDWPGVRSAPGQIGTPETVRRPNFFFRKKGPTPETATLLFTKPPGFEGETEEDFARRLEAAVEAHEESIRQRFRERKRKFMGPKRVLTQSRYDFPRTPERRGDLNPRVACRDKWRRIAALQANKQFLEDYRIALREFCARMKRGGKDALEVVFPRGTYWMRVHYGVRCESAPVPAPS